jgi:hypothetical protein
MLIRRTKHATDFLILANATVRDERLSYTARGVLAELLSRADGWETTADRMSQQARRARGSARGEGRRAIRAAWAELEAAGYLHRFRAQDEAGRWTTTTVVTDVPHTRK